ncbi:hypothetical protein R1flu_017558 [Riccia fluitans]|uniref:5'-3' exonuclease alpha-helical arch N-terminal domain-containing protein n=1 Tax=Riccia fluitans TaxID=41844 RepID=A0ABD1ZEL4_9MARC
MRSAETCNDLKTINEAGTCGQAGKQKVAVVEIRVLLALNRGSVLDLNISGAGKMGHGITLQVKANSELSSGEARLLFCEDVSLTFSTFFPRRRTQPNKAGIVKASTAVTKVKVPLELEDAKEPLLKVRKKKAPYKRLVKSVERIVEPTAARETCQITIDHSGSVPHKERQSYSVTAHVLKLENAEADDVVATLMHQAVKKGMRVVVAYPDMDFRQLLSEDVNS